MTVFRKLAAGAVGWIALGACRGLIDADDFGVRSTRCGESTFEEPACGTCTENACCAETEACGQSAACTKLHTCLASCRADEPACRAACAKIATEDDAAVALSNCRVQQCATACGACSGGVYWTPDVGSCHDCVREFCCDEATQCGLDAECNGAQRCVRYAPPDGCRNEATGEPLGEPFGEVLVSNIDCVQLNCKEPCREGESWACVDDYAWPTPPRDRPVPIQVAAYDAITLEPISSAVVKVCRDEFAGACASPLAQGMTGNGGVELEVEFPVRGDALHVLVDAGEDYVPTSWHDVRPLYFAFFDEPIVIGIAVVARDDLPQIESVFGAQIDLARAVVVAGDFDCVNSPTNGAVLALANHDAQTTLRYLTPGAIPIPNASGTERGGAVFLNAPTGPNRVITSHDDKEVSSLTLHLHAGTVHYVAQRPRALEGY